MLENFSLCAVLVDNIEKDKYIVKIPIYNTEILIRILVSY